MDGTPSTPATPSGESPSSASDKADAGPDVYVNCANPPRKPQYFDVKHVYGESLDDASSAALKEGYSMRAAEIDGRPNPAPDLGNVQRINVSVKQGKVTGYCGLG